MSGIFTLRSIRVCLLSLIAVAWGCDDDGDFRASVDARATDTSDAAPPDLVPESPDESDMSLADTGEIGDTDGASATDAIDAAAGGEIDAGPDGDEVSTDDLVDRPDVVEAPQVSDGNADALASEVQGSEVHPDAFHPLAPCSGAACPTGIAPDHLQLWLRGDIGVDCSEAVAGRVTLWRDISGRGNDARPASGEKGPVCNSSSAELNGRKVLGFPRGSDALAGEHLEVDFRSLAGKSLTIAVVERRTGDPVAGAWMIGAPLPSADSYFCQAVANVNAGRALALGYDVPINLTGHFWGPACHKGVAVPLVPDKPSVVMMIYSPGRGVRLFVDGVKGDDVMEVGLERIERGFIGRGYRWAPDGIDGRYQGTIAEVVVYSTALEDEPRRALDTYLTQTWGTGN